MKSIIWTIISGKMFISCFRQKSWIGSDQSPRWRGWCNEDERHFVVVHHSIALLTEVSTAVPIHCPLLATLLVPFCCHMTSDNPANFPLSQATTGSHHRAFLSTSAYPVNAMVRLFHLIRPNDYINCYQLYFQKKILKLWSDRNGQIYDPVNVLFSHERAVYTRCF